MRSMNFSRRFLLCIVATTALIFPVAFGQIPAAESPRTTGMAATQLDFDVVSVKPGKPGCLLVQIGPSPDGFHLQCIPLSALIRYAYGYGAFNDERVLGEPSWIKFEAYDVDAKVEFGDTGTFDKLSLEQKETMLQPILKSRFKLGVHQETKVLPVYALVIGKGGDKLKESSPDDLATKTLPTLRMRGRGKLEGHHCSIKEMLSFLSPLQGRTIVDRTGLSGKYEFTLSWTPNSMTTDAPAEDESRPSIFTAVQEQLGLKLEVQKAPLNVLVVDHVERPSVN